MAKYKQLGEVNTGVICATFCSVCCNFSLGFKLFQNKKVLSVREDYFQLIGKRNQGALPHSRGGGPLGEELPRLSVTLLRAVPPAQGSDICAAEAPP